MNTETILYPFSAIVGQDDLKKALLLCAINPAIGGVLIKGEKGTAKSTAVRGLVQVMPALASGGAAVPFVDLPLGVSEDRLSVAWTSKQSFPAGQKNYCRACSRARMRAFYISTK